MLQYVLNNYYFFIVKRFDHNYYWKALYKHLLCMYVCMYVCYFMILEAQVSFFPLVFMHSFQYEE